jgi:hypothetical protein
MRDRSHLRCSLPASSSAWMNASTSLLLCRSLSTASEYSRALAAYCSSKWSFSSQRTVVSQSYRASDPKCIFDAKTRPFAKTILSVNLLRRTAITPLTSCLTPGVHFTQLFAYIPVAPFSGTYALFSLMTL